MGTQRETGRARQEQAPPPYYIATEPLFIGGDPFSRAHNPGDRVPADHVEQYGWADKVRHPDQPSNEPETPQATPERTDA